MLPSMQRHHKQIIFGPEGRYFSSMNLNRLTTLEYLLKIDGKPEIAGREVGMKLEQKAAFLMDQWQLPNRPYVRDLMIESHFQGRSIAEGQQDFPRPVKFPCQDQDV